jgi:mono/diheme cytochrome c family protein
LKATLAALAVCVSLLSISLPMGSQEKESKVARKQSPSVYAELAKAPEKARNRSNPLESDPEAIAAGRLLFEDHCAECHGDNAEGGKKGPNLRATEVQNSTPGTLFWLLTNGVVRKGMPVWSKLPEPQRWQLIRYVKSLGMSQEPAATSSQTPR